jgi:hypothetical protein
MKDLLKRGLAVLSMLITLTLSASNLDPVIEVLKEHEMSIKFTLDGLKENSEVLVKDQYGVILYRESVGKRNYSKKFNFEELNSGNYTMEIHDQASIEKFPFIVNYNKVIFSQGKEVKVFKPIVSMRGSIVTISKLALNKEILSIVLLDDNSNVLYKGLLTGNRSLIRRLDISSFPKGEYRVAMKSGGSEFIESISLK